MRVEYNGHNLEEIKSIMPKHRKWSFTEIDKKLLITFYYNGKPGDFPVYVGGVVEVLNDSWVHLYPRGL